jgi:hypothetical protein
MRPAVRAALWVPWLCACAGRSAPGTVERHDSVGVDIVESRAAAWGATSPWSIDSVPALDLARRGAGPSYQFSRVEDATRLADGRLVVLDGDSHQVRFYGSDGAFQHALGQDGDGPGDFRRVSDVFAFRGDSVVVFDSWLRRATILDDEGGLGRVVTFPKDLQSPHLHPLGSGAFLALAWSLGEFAKISGDYRTRYAVERISADGEVGDTLAVIPAWNGHKEGVGDRYIDYAPIFPVAGVVAVNRDAIVMGAGDVMEFSRYSPEGALTQIVRVPSLDEPLSAGEIAAERASLLRPSSTAAARQRVESFPAPPLRPAYHDLQLDPGGHVWAAGYHSPRRQRDDPTTWHVFGKDGAWLGDLVTPSRFQVFEIGEDYVLGVRRDSLDVEDVEVLPLRRAAS